MDNTRVFKSGRNDLCFCGSGQRFRDCCGSLAADRPPPHGLQVIEHYLEIAECRRLAEYAGTRPGEPLTVLDVAASTTDKIVRRLDPGRVTEQVDLGPEQASLNRIVRAALTDRIEAQSGGRIEWFEAPQLLRYRPGGFYKGHADSEKFDAETSAWIRVLDRDVSLLLYLNDEYTGGTLSFPNFHYVLRPRAGMLVFFPSDNRYYHSADPVSSGIRYAVVSWASLRDGRKIHSHPPEGAISLHG